MDTPQTNKHCNIKLSDKLEFGKIDITDFTVAVGLTFALIVSIGMNMMELAMSLGSGLLGFVGGTKMSSRIPTAQFQALSNLSSVNRIDQQIQSINANMSQLVQSLQYTLEKTKPLKSQKEPTDQSSDTILPIDNQR